MRELLPHYMYKIKRCLIRLLSQQKVSLVLSDVVREPRNNMKMNGDTPFDQTHNYQQGSRVIPPISVDSRLIY